MGVPRIPRGARGKTITPREISGKDLFRYLEKMGVYINPLMLGSMVDNRTPLPIQMDVKPTGKTGILDIFTEISPDRVWGISRLAKEFPRAQSIEDALKGGSGTARQFVGTNRFVIDPKTAETLRKILNPPTDVTRMDLAGNKTRHGNNKGVANGGRNKGVANGGRNKGVANGGRNKGVANGGRKGDRKGARRHTSPRLITDTGKKRTGPAERDGVRVEPRKEYKSPEKIALDIALANLKPANVKRNPDGTLDRDPTNLHQLAQDIRLVMRAETRGVWYKRKRTITKEQALELKRYESRTIAFWLALNLLADDAPKGLIEVSLERRYVGSEKIMEKYEKIVKRPASKNALALIEEMELKTFLNLTVPSARGIERAQAKLEGWQYMKGVIDAAFGGTRISKEDMESAIQGMPTRNPFKHEIGLELEFFSGKRLPQPGLEPTGLVGRDPIYEAMKDAFEEEGFVTMLDPGAAIFKGGREAHVLPMTWDTFRVSVDITLQVVVGTGCTLFRIINRSADPTSVLAMKAKSMDPFEARNEAFTMAENLFGIPNLHNLATPEAKAAGKYERRYLLLIKDPGPNTDIAKVTITPTITKKSGALRFIARGINGTLINRNMKRVAEMVIDIADMKEAKMILADRVKRSRSADADLARYVISPTESRDGRFVIKGRDGRRLYDGNLDEVTSEQPMNVATIQEAILVFTHRAKRTGAAIMEKADKTMGLYVDGLKGPVKITFEEHPYQEVVSPKIRVEEIDNFMPAIKTLEELGFIGTTNSIGVGVHVHTNLPTRVDTPNKVRYSIGPTIAFMREYVKNVAKIRAIVPTTSNRRPFIQGYPTEFIDRILDPDYIKDPTDRATILRVMADIVKNLDKKYVELNMDNIITALGEQMIEAGVLKNGETYETHWNGERYSFEVGSDQIFRIETTGEMTKLLRVKSGDQKTTGEVRIFDTVHRHKGKISINPADPHAEMVDQFAIDPETTKFFAKFVAALGWLTAHKPYLNAKEPLALPNLSEPAPQMSLEATGTGER